VRIQHKLAIRGSSAEDTQRGDKRSQSQVSQCGNEPVGHKERRRSSQKRMLERQTAAKSDSVKPLKHLGGGSDVDRLQKTIPPKQKPGLNEL